MKISPHSRSYVAFSPVLRRDAGADPPERRRASGLDHCTPPLQARCLPLAVHSWRLLTVSGCERSLGEKHGGWRSLGALYAIRPLVAAHSIVRRRLLLSSSQYELFWV